MVKLPMTSQNPERCCEAVRSANLATDWLLVHTGHDNDGQKNRLNKAACIASRRKNVLVLTLQELVRFDMLCPLVWLVCKK